MIRVFGYGSLLGLQRPGAAQVQAIGLARRWGVAMDNAVDLPGYKFYTADGERPAVQVAFLDVVEQPGGLVDGVSFPVLAAELATLDARERSYQRVDITHRLHPTLPGRTYCYVGLAAARDRCARARKAGTGVVQRAYLDAVTAALAGLARTGGGAVAAPLPPFPVRDLQRHDLP